MDADPPAEQPAVVRRSVVRKSVVRAKAVEIARGVVKSRDGIWCVSGEFPLRIRAGHRKEEAIWTFASLTRGESCMAVGTRG